MRSSKIPGYTRSGVPKPGRLALELFNWEIEERQLLDLYTRLRSGAEGYCNDRELQ